MDFVQRLALLLLLSLPAFLPGNAHANYSVSMLYQFSGAQVNGGTGGIQYYTSMQQACDDYHAYELKSVGTNGYTSFTQVPYNILQCREKSNKTTSAYDFYTNGYQYKLCGTVYQAWNASPGNGLCSGTCAAPNILNSTTGICEPPPPCHKGDLISQGYYDGGKDPKANFPHITCENGCSATFEGTWPKSQAKQGDGMHYYAYGSFAKDGFNCTAGAASPSATPNQPLDIDQQAALERAANEKAAAAAKAAADKAAQDAKNAAAKEAARAAAEAAENAKADAAAKAADAARLKALKADADAAAAKVAADTTASQADKDAANAKAAAAGAASSAADSAAASAQAASGAAAGVAAKTAQDAQDKPPEKPDFCETHPSSLICKDSSVNTGYCDSQGNVSGFNCTGDAVQCAIANTEVSQFCKNSATDTDLTAKFDAAKTDESATNMSLPKNGSIINLPDSLDASSPYEGSCNPDVNVSFNGESVTVPLSAWCTVLESLGYLFLACAYLAAAKILGGSA